MEYAENKDNGRPRNYQGKLYAGGGIRIHMERNVPMDFESSASDDHKSSFNI